MSIPAPSHKRLNDMLSIVVVLLAFYIILLPLLPQISYLLRDKSPEASAPYGGFLAQVSGALSPDNFPVDNRLVIPSIGLDEPILESSYISIIEDGGTWHRPNSVTPTTNGNSIIVGHRFYGNSVSTFYHLDKIEVGELFAVYWEGEEILYRVDEKKVVDDTATEIEAPTVDRRLTLYTCHPLWSSDKRLVIVAKPVDESTIEDGAP